MFVTEKNIMMGRTCLIFVILVVGLVVNDATAGSENLGHRVASHGRDERSVVGANDKAIRRQKRSLSDVDRVAIVSAANQQRRLIEASDMTYLEWNTTLEHQLLQWTRQCDFDREIGGDAQQFYPVKIASTSLNHTDNIRRIFLPSSEHYDKVRSAYFTSISGAYTFCNSAVINEFTYKNVHMLAYGFPYLPAFKNGGAQYKEGPPCTGCSSKSYWCFEDLCRGDCNSNIEGCSCNPECNCGVVNRSNCTCQCSPGWVGPVCEVRSKGNTAKCPLHCPQQKSKKTKKGRKPTKSKPQSFP